jgi:hypothetical protein
VLARWTIRFVTSIVGIAAGLLISAIVLGGNFSIGFVGFIEAALLFWIVHLIVTFVALRILVRQPSIAMVGLLALAATVISLIIVSLVVGGVTIHHPGTYFVAAVIIWITTAIGDAVGRNMIRNRRQERR